MIKEIKYNGYTANPSDYECSDGDLATTIGLVQEEGAMKPILPPLLVMQLDNSDVVTYIHKTANIEHYIILNGSTLKWWNGNGEKKELHTFSSTIHQITSVGNTLVVLASDGMHYFLWKGTSDGYLNMGTELPECTLSFGLLGEMKKSNPFTISFDSISKEKRFDEFTDENKTKITEQVLAKVNKFIAEESTNKGKFIYPFLLRYAYRLYDGRLTKHSAPILMVASSDLAPQVFWTSLTGSEGSVSSATLEVVSVLHTIDYAANSSDVATLASWKDIIRSVDIFISKPIYTYNQNGECTGFVDTDDKNYKDCFSICKHTNQAASKSAFPVKYQYNEFRKLYAFTYCPEDETNINNLTYPLARLLLPRRSTDDVTADVKNCSTFYFLESIKVEQLAAERTAIKVSEEYLQSLVTREVMTDDYDSHDKLMPRYSFPYNSRLNVANIQKSLFKGQSTNSLFPYSDGFIAPTLNVGTYSTEVYVHIRQDGKEIVVKADDGSIAIKAPILYFYYPNINAYKAVIKRYNLTATLTHEIPLEQHAFLNGVFYFGGWSDIDKESSVPTPSSGDGLIVNMPNKIYTSEVNNPFYFPLLGINTVGTGEILGISSAAKALSEGQFGQFPLYAFTTDGVWALEVSGTGTYSAKQPITRDVVINPDSITQIDSAVLFATDRGIMHISGSSVQCISDNLNTEEQFSITQLPKADALISLFNKSAAENEQISIDDILLLPFSQFLVDCRMVYDYTNQRIIVYNPSVRYAYVYSLKSHTWGMMRSDIVSNVNSYPEALAMADGGRLVDFSQADTGTTTTTTSLIVTRPFKMDAANTLKTIDTIIQRGMFHSTHVMQILYGSSDLVHWHTVWSSVDRIIRGFRGTPYKAYRLALLCKLDKGESIYGFSVVYHPRMGNKIR